MKKHTSGGLFIAVLLAASLVTTPLTSSAQDKEKPAAAAEAKQPRPYPFSGKLGAVDKEKKTITILGKEKSRTLYLDGQTKIMKQEKPATLEDAAVGEDVAGQLRKTEDGKEMVISLRIGPKPAAEEKPAKEKAPKPAKD
jgi:Cu/Ag efflux protein CusF